MKKRDYLFPLIATISTFVVFVILWQMMSIIIDEPMSIRTNIILALFYTLATVMLKLGIDLVAYSFSMLRRAYDDDDWDE